MKEQNSGIPGKGEEKAQNTGNPGKTDANHFVEDDVINQNDLHKIKFINPQIKFDERYNQALEDLKSKLHKRWIKTKDCDVSGNFGNREVELRLIDMEFKVILELKKGDEE